MLVTRFIQRAAMTAAQKTGATLATRVVTSAAATFAGCVVQSKIMKSKSAQLQEKVNNGEEVSEQDIKTAQNQAFTSAAIATGVCSGAGLIANNAIANAIRGL